MKTWKIIVIPSLKMFFAMKNWSSKKVTKETKQKNVNKSKIPNQIVFNFLPYRLTSISIGNQFLYPCSNTFTRSIFQRFQSISICLEKKAEKVPAKKNILVSDIFHSNILESQVKHVLNNSCLLFSSWYANRMLNEFSFYAQFFRETFHAWNRLVIIPISAASSTDEQVWCITHL